MTDQKIIERLAEFVDLVPIVVDFTNRKVKMYTSKNDKRKRVRFNPLENWNHWRECEEKVMEYDKKNNEKLLIKMTAGTAEEKTRILSYTNDIAAFVGFMLLDYIESDLSTRCNALVSVLPKNE